MAICQTHVIHLVLTITQMEQHTQLSMLLKGMQLACLNQCQVCVWHTGTTLAVSLNKTADVVSTVVLPDAACLQNIILVTFVIWNNWGTENIS